MKQSNRSFWELVEGKLLRITFLLLWLLVFGHLLGQRWEVFGSEEVDAANLAQLAEAALAQQKELVTAPAVKEFIAQVKNYAQLVGGPQIGDKSPSATGSGKGAKESYFAQIQRLYSEADKKVQEDFYLPFYPEKYQELYQQGELIKKALLGLLEQEDLDPRDKYKALLSYTLGVYVTTSDFFGLWPENKPEDFETDPQFQQGEGKKYQRAHGQDEYVKFRQQILAQLVPMVPEELATVEYAVKYMQQGLVLKKFDGRNFQLVLDDYARVARFAYVSAAVPSVFNYMKAARLWTIHSMLELIRTQRTLAGMNGEFKIPASCQGPFDTSLASHLKIDELAPEKRREAIDNLLMENGIYVREDDVLGEALKTYFLQTDNPTLDNGGFLSLLPFQRFFYAKKALEGEKNVAIDDLTEYDSVVAFIAKQHMIELEKSLRMRQANQGKPRQQDHRNPQNKIDFSQVEMAMAKIVAPYEVPVSEQMSKEQQLQASAQNEKFLGITHYLADKTIASNQLTWMQIIPPGIIAQLEKNKVDLNIFPLKNSSDSWMKWILHRMAVVFYAPENENTLKINMPIGNCSPGPYSLNKCLTGSGKSKLGLRRSEEAFNQTRDFLKEFLPETHDYLPNFYKSYYTFNENWDFLQAVWELVTDTYSMIPPLYMSEWEYLKGQMYDRNYWASARISYLLAREELGQQSVVYAQHLTKLAKYFGLDRVLHPYHGNRILSQDQRQELWHEIISQQNAHSANIFNTLSTHHRRPDNPKEMSSYYDFIDRLNNSVLFGEDEVKRFLKTVDLRPDPEALLQDLEKVRQNKDREYFQLYYDLFQAKGNVDRQEQIVDVILQKEVEMQKDQQGTEINRYQIRKLFFDNVQAIKLPIYHYLVMGAARKKQQDLTNLMDKLCRYDINDREQFKDLYAATIKAQEQLQQSLKIKMPQVIEERKSYWNRLELLSMYTGLGAGIVWMVGAGLTFGGVAPLYAVALGTIGVLGQVATFGLEFNDVLMSHERASEIMKFVDNGYSNQEEHDNVKRYLHGQPVLEFAFIWPMVSFPARLLTVAPSIVSAQKTAVWKQMSKVERKLFYQNALENAETKWGMYNLGELSASQSLRETFQLIKQGPLNVKKFFSMAWAPFKKEMSETVVVKMSPAQINRDFAQTASLFFWNKPERFVSFLESFTKNRLFGTDATPSKIVKAKNRVASAAYQNLKNFDTNKVTEKLVKWTFDFIKWRGKRAEKFLAHEQFLYQLLDEAKNLPANNPKALENLLNEHAERFCAFLEDAPFRKREAFYFAIALGSPAKRGRGLLLSKIAELTVMQRLGSSRNHLLYQSYRQVAADRLHIPAGIKLHGTYQLVKAYQEGIAQLLQQAEEGLDLKVTTKALQKLDDQMLDNILGYLREEPKWRQFLLENFGTVDKWNRGRVKMMLFAPQTVQQKANAELIWGQIPTDRIFNLGGTEETIRLIAEELATQFAKDSTLDNLYALQAALKIRLISKAPQIINLF